MSATKLTAAITAADIASPGLALVYVFSPAPGGGTSNARQFTVTETPSNNSTWYLAEGSTAYGFSTYISIENPNNTAVTIDMTYMTKAGAVPGGSFTMPAMSQSTVNPVDAVGATDFSTKVTCRDNKPIAVDRTMSWTGPGAPSPEAHSSVGVTSAATKWYLPEGSSKWGFETWLLVQNPSSKSANIIITYMVEGGTPKAVKHTVAKNSRDSYSLREDAGVVDASIKVESDVPVISERAVYRNKRRDGHCSIGTTTPAKDYFLAEGTTSWGFTAYVLVQNPNPESAQVKVTYLTLNGEVSHPENPINMAGNSRKTIRVNNFLPSSDFSTKVKADRPIIAERAMYWGEGKPLGEACHDSIGMSEPHKTFYLPDGETSNGRETWTLVANPNTIDVSVRISYLKPSGGKGNVIFEETVSKGSRRTFSMADKGINGRAAILVECLTTGKKIMVERSMYWNNRGAGTDTIGGYSD